MFYDDANRFLQWSQIFPINIRANGPTYSINPCHRDSLVLSERIRNKRPQINQFCVSRWLALNEICNGWWDLGPADWRLWVYLFISSKWCSPRSITDRVGGDMPIQLIKACLNNIVLPQLVICTSSSGSVSFWMMMMIKLPRDTVKRGCDNLQSSSFSLLNLNCVGLCQSLNFPQRQTLVFHTFTHCQRKGIHHPKNVGRYQTNFAK